MADDDKPEDGQTTKSDTADEQAAGSDGDQETSSMRDGITARIDPNAHETEKLTPRTDDGEPQRAEDLVYRDAGIGERQRPPDLPEQVDVASAAPDGTAIGGTRLSGAGGEEISGSSLSGDLQSRAGTLGGDALSGDRLDPLGLTSRGTGADTGGQSASGPGGMDDLVSGRRGGHISAEGGVTVTTDPNFTPPEGYDASGFFVPDEPIDTSGYFLPDDNPPDTSGYLLPDDNPPDASGYVDPAQPDPTAGDEVITGESIAAAIATNDPGVYAQPTQDSSSNEGNATVLGWAAPANDPRLTNYGPEGEPGVQANANWAPPVDTLFDPPPEASGGSLGAEASMADPASALGGSLVGSSQPEDFPPPPDPPPGDDGTSGPPGGGDDGEG